MDYRLTSLGREVNRRQGRRLHDLCVDSSHRDFYHTLRGKAQLSKRRPTEIDEYWMSEGATVRNSDDDTLAIVKPCDPQPGIKWKKIACCSRRVVHVVDLTISHHVAVKVLTIPGRDAVQGSERRRLRGAGTFRHQAHQFGEIAGESGKYRIVANPVIQNIPLKPNSYDLSNRLRRRDGQPVKFKRPFIGYIGIVDGPIAGQLANSMIVY